MQVTDEPERGRGVLCVLDGYVPRLRGLLGTDCHAQPVLITECSSIHTVGMRYEIDAAFVSGAGEVLRVCRGLPPLRLRSCGGSACVVERPAAAGEWLKPGDQLQFLEMFDAKEERANADEGSLWVQRDGGGDDEEGVHCRGTSAQPEA